MEDYGLVSIITPTYNCGKFISETIESVLSQTYQNWELIISDDCSTDNTKEIIKPYLERDSRIKYICNEHNSGAAITRNAAIRKATGKWIAFLDSDDLWLPEKLEHQLQFMVTNGYDFSYHEYHEITEDGKDMGVFVSGISKVNAFNMFSCCWPGCLTVMYNRDKVGLIQIANIPKNNDSAMWLKVVRKSPCYLLKENLACYRRRKGSITPPGIFKRIFAHYPLFRVSEEMNPVSAFLFSLLNIVGNSYKKIFFVKRP